MNIMNRSSARKTSMYQLAKYCVDKKTNNWWAFLRTFLFEFSSEVSIFVIILLTRNILIYIVMLLKGWCMRQNEISAASIAGEKIGHISWVAFTSIISYFAIHNFSMWSRITFIALSVYLTQWLYQKDFQKISSPNVRRT